MSDDGKTPRMARLWMALGMSAPVAWASGWHGRCTREWIAQELAGVVVDARDVRPFAPRRQAMPWDRDPVSSADGRSATRHGVQ